MTQELMIQDAAPQHAAIPDIDRATAASLIQDCYDALLGRDADEFGLRTKVDRLLSGEASLGDALREIMASAEFASRVPTILAGSPDVEALRFTNDMSQFGEIWRLVRTWVNAQAVCGVVVDVGARGRERSNSYDLMRHFGWSGLLIEANPALIASIQRDFAGLDLRLLSCAVSDYTGQATFTLGSNNDVSSLNAALAENWGDTKGAVEVEVRRLSDILREHAIPEVFDLLSLDIEGEDIKVLNDLIDTSAYRPAWVIIEASDDFRVRTLNDAPFSPTVRANYVVRAATSANLILCRRHPERAAWAARRDADQRA